MKNKYISRRERALMKKAFEAGRKSKPDTEPAYSIGFFHGNFKDFIYKNKYNLKVEEPN